LGRQKALTYSSGKGIGNYSQNLLIGGRKAQWGRARSASRGEGCPFEREKSSALEYASGEGFIWVKKTNFVGLDGDARGDQSNRAQRQPA